MDYKTAGVDITGAEKALQELKADIRQTFTPRVLYDIGHFGGMFDAQFSSMNHPVLVASTDGVGTKLLVAIMANIHNTIGMDLVHHCINDILACGAHPLFFLDYFATGHLSPRVFKEVLQGIITACKNHNCALLGGETAEMPDMYAPEHYDLVGTIVGVVDKSHILTGTDIEPGDQLIGLYSAGLHTNGYSLARKVLLSHYSLEQYIPELGRPLAEELLKVHRSYYHLVTPLLQNRWIKGIAHITGGGIPGNLNRILPKTVRALIDWQSWERPPIFSIIQSLGNIAEEEMRTVFNLGIGMILIASPQNTASILQQIEEEGTVIGEIVPSTE